MTPRPSIPAITAQQMREVDRLMVAHYGIQLIQMMENAGLNLAQFSRRFLGGSVAQKRIIVAAGKGNNGGGGVVAARHLHNWGGRVTVALQSPEVSGVPEVQLEILRKLPVEVGDSEAALALLSADCYELALDALIGYSLSGAPGGVAAKLIERLNGLSSPVISLDLPSGLDANTGEIRQPCVKATATVTLALPKTGLLAPSAAAAVGELYLADIGVPAAVYEQMGLEVGNIFAEDTLIRL